MEIMILISGVSLMVNVYLFRALHQSKEVIERASDSLERLVRELEESREAKDKSK